jgi:Ca2+-binding RTX toxin-like protein
VIAGNHAGDDGGGIFNGPTLTSSGPGPIEPGGDLAIENSTIAGNESDYSGGGVFHRLGGELTLRGSTLSGNTAGQYGGAIFSPFGDLVTVASSTISGNTAGEAFGGIATVTADVALTNTIIANSIATGDRGSLPDRSLRGGPPVETSATQDLGTAEGSFAGEFSLVEDPGDNEIAPLSPGRVITGVDPQLGPLASNGGPTQTHLPALTSPVLDQGIAGGLATDQRGLARTGDLGAIGNALGGGDGTDIGSVEIQAADCQGQGALRIDGTTGDDTLTGTGGPDAIAGLAGNDRADASAGIDCISGDEGKDTVGGGGGPDRLNGGAGKDKLKGGGGTDRLAGSGGKDKLSGGGGKDKLKGGPGKDKLKGGGGKDRFNCGGGQDKVTAQAKDRVSGSCEKVVERG